MNKLKLIFAFVLIIVNVLHAQTQQAQPSLTIGHPAPPLEVKAWLKGTPVKALEKGKIYVIEFWATWCGPCINAMPHLSKLARQYRDELTVIGVSVAEGRSGRIPEEGVIQRFVNDQGENMDYTVAMDDPATNRVYDQWMRQAGLGGIPATFVINKEGNIAWIGHPMRLDRVLEQLIEAPEEFDPEEVNREYEFQENQIRQANKSIATEFSAKNYSNVLVSIQQQIDADPKQEIEHFWKYVQAQMRIDVDKANAYILARAADPIFMERMRFDVRDMTAAKEELLDRFAFMVSQDFGWPLHVYYDAYDRVKNQVDKQPSSRLLNALSVIYAELNVPDKAIEATEKGIELLKAEIAQIPDEPENVRAIFARIATKKQLDDMTEKLSIYRQLKAMKDKLTIW